MAKFEPGRTCLVLGSLARPDMIGRKIVLKNKHFHHFSRGVKVEQVCWTIEPPIWSLNSEEGEVIFIQSKLLPVDDPDDLRLISEHDAEPIKIPEVKKVDDWAGINLQLERLAEEFAALKKYADEIQKYVKEAKERGEL